MSKYLRNVSGEVKTRQRLDPCPFPAPHGVSFNWLQSCRVSLKEVTHHQRADLAPGAREGPQLALGKLGRRSERLRDRLNPSEGGGLEPGLLRLRGDSWRLNPWIWGGRL